MIRAVLAALLLAAAPAADQKSLLQGKLPDGPARKLVEGKCMLCHTGEYVTQVGPREPLAKPSALRSASK